MKSNTEKVAFVTTYWKNSPGGGVKTYLSGLAEALQEKGCDVNVVFREGDDSNNYKITGSRFVFPFIALYVLLQIKPKVVHSHGSWYCLMAGVLYKMFSRQKLIHTFHSTPEKNLSKGGRWFMQQLVNKCDYATFVSKALKADIESVYKLRFKSTSITYGGVSDKKVTQNDIDSFREKFMIPTNSTVLLAQAFTANKMKAEGLKICMEAVKTLLSKHPQITLLVTREGAYSDELKYYAQRIGLASNIIFTGDLVNPFVAIRVCDLFIHTPLVSLGGPSLALFEAMSMGKPCIVSSKGKIHEVIRNRHNGILVTDDIYDIAGGIELLLNDMKLAKMLGNEAEKTVRLLFTWGACADKFLKLYNGNL
jgi:glycosyltransferase involved in cell wall biosynthesis